MTNADDPALSALDALLKANDLDATDSLNTIAVLAKTKKTLATQFTPKQESTCKIFKGKELIHPCFTGAFIYKNSKTKNRYYLIRIFNEESKRPLADHPKPPAEKAVIDTQVIYRAPLKTNKTLDWGIILIIIGWAIFRPAVGKRGFWDDQERATKIQDKKPVLKRQANSIP